MQQEENYLAQSISQVDADARYDEGVKRLLANKSILAVIMKECVPEYHGCTVREIAEKYIEGEPQIGAVGVDADETNRNVSATIHGTNTEDVTLTEGTIRYDVRFYATAPSEDGLIGLILNVEAQNRYNAGYPLLKRAIYYCSRMISAQYGTEFTKGEYGKIKKVYSIWVCMNPPKNRRNTITQYSIQEKHIIIKKETVDTLLKQEDFDPAFRTNLENYLNIAQVYYALPKGTLKEDIPLSISIKELAKLSNVSSLEKTYHILHEDDRELSCILKNCLTAPTAPKDASESE